MPLQTLSPQKFSYPSLQAICLIALALRVIWVILVPVIPVSDSAAYDVFAQNIWQHNTYGWTPDRPTSYWPVGTSAIYAFFYGLFGYSYWPISIFNVLCSLGIIVISYRLVERFFGNTTMACCTALLLALWPTSIFFSTILASELPYTFLVLAGIYAITDNSSKKIIPGLVAGLLFVGAYYIRPLAVIPLAIAVFTLFIQRREFSLTLTRGVVASLLLILLVLPWAHRNYQLYGAWVSMSTNGGATLWMGNHPGTDGSYQDLPKDVMDLDEHTRNQVLKQRAIDYIKAEPVTFVTRTLVKLVKFHTRETIGVSWNEPGLKKRFGEWIVVPLKGVAQLYWSLLLVIAFVGLFFYWKRNGFWSLAFNPFILLWGSTAAIHAIIVSQDRYHIPIVPVVTMFAAYFWCFLTKKDTDDNNV